MAKTRKAVVLESLINGDHHYLAGPDSIDVPEAVLARYPSKFEFRGKDEAIANLEMVRAELAETSADEEDNASDSNEEE